MGGARAVRRAPGCLARLLALVALWLLPGPPVQAHAIRTAYLEIVELEPGQAMMRWRTPIHAPEVRPRLAATCRQAEGRVDGDAPIPSAAVEKGSVSTNPNPPTPFPGREGGAKPDVFKSPFPSREGGFRGLGFRTAENAAFPTGSGSDEVLFAVRCPGPLAGETVSIDGLGPHISEAVVWVSLAGGMSASRLLTRAAAEWRLPRATSSLELLWEYVRLGVEHILGGIDHLVFLVLLVLTLRRPKAVLVAETAFTLSHSLSFGATALGWIRVSSSAAEACIALSLVLVALDVGRRDAPVVSMRGGAGLAFVFGLVHGLGFAGGLQALGVPERDAARALVGFGLGVELGQVMFLLVVLALVGLAARSRLYPRIALSVGYAAGGVSTFWLLERLMTCFRSAG